MLVRPPLTTREAGPARFPAPVEEDGSLKMLLANVRTGVKKEETFSQLEDGLWTAKYVDVPDEREGVYSNVESVRKNRFSVNYNYRTESDDSAPRYNQVCVYEFDSLAGEFVITEVGDRKPE